MIILERKTYSAKDIYNIMYKDNYNDKKKELEPERYCGATDDDIHKYSDEHAKKMLDGFLNEDYQEAADYVNHMTFPMQVYRGLWIPSNDISKVNTQKVGIYWTCDPNFIKKRTLFKYNFVLIGDVVESDVNFPETIKTFMWYSGGHSARTADYSVQKIPEMEVTLKNRKIPNNLEVCTYEEFCSMF